MAIISYGCTCHRDAVRKDDEDAWAWSSRLEAEAQQELERAFLTFRQRILDAVELLGAVRASRIMDTLPWEEAEAELLATWERVASRLLSAAGQHQVNALHLPPEAFSVDNTYALEWMKTHGSELITEVSDATKEAVRNIVQSGVTEHDTVRDIARDIRRQVGLRSDQIRAAENYRDTLEESGMDPEEIDANIEAYNRRQLNQRAQLIARTETGNGVTEGTRQAWKVARDREYLPPTTKRRWNAGAEVDNKGRRRTCEFCRDFHGALADMDGEYTSRSGTRRSPGPTAGAHPACRCSESIVVSYDE